MKQKITAIIIARNEEARIVPCLESIKWCDEIVVVDDMSTDSTALISRKYGAKVIASKSNGNHDMQRNIGIDNASGDWILQLDADERVTEGLKRDIQKVLISNNGYSAYKVGRKNYFLGKFMKFGGWHESHTRLFRKDRARYVGHSVHETLEVNGKIRLLKSDLDHYAFSSVSQYIDRQLYYAGIEARLMHEDIDKITLKEIKKHIYSKPLKIFFKLYIRKMGFRDGMHGFIFSVLNAWRHFTIWSLYYSRYYKG